MNFRAALFRLLVPGSLVLAVAVLVWFWQPRPAFLVASLPLYPYFVVVLAAFLAWRFRRSRALLLLMLTVSGYALPMVVPSHWHNLAQQLWLLLLPLNLLWLGLIAERQLLSWAMLGRLLFVCSQPLVMILWRHYRPDLFNVVLHLSPPHWPWAADVQVLPLVVLSYGVSLIGLLLVLLRRPAVEEATLVWSLVLVGVAEFTPGELRSYLFATVGLLLVVSLLEISHAMAYRDELTGLESRRSLRDLLLRLRSGYCIALVDIDHFKKVNDTHGHDVGDQVLKMVAGQLDRLSHGARAFRYGGEEFVLVFAADALDEVVDVVESVREQISQTPFALRSQPRPAQRPKPVVRSGQAVKTLRVTVSVGVAAWQRGLSSEQVIKTADQALYRAKKAGRNRVVKG